MADQPDAFAHHPELRDMIADPETSFHRDFSVAKILKAHPEMEPLLPFVYSDATREAMRADVLRDHTGDLWIFGYGSLMWDPALRFTDVRRARLAGYARKFILVDDKGGRGTADAPGVFACLDDGEGCDGVAFKIAASDVEIETEILCRRELIEPGYLPAMVPLQIAGGTVTALTFVADHSCDDIQPDLTRDTQVRYIATGVGILGTNYDYLANINKHFSMMGIADTYCLDLLRDVDAYRAAMSPA